MGVAWGGDGEAENRKEGELGLEWKMKKKLNKCLKKEGKPKV